MPKYNKNDGWKVSKKGILSTSKKAAVREKKEICKQNKNKIQNSPYAFTGMIGKSRLEIQTDRGMISEEELKLLRTTTPWELGEDVFFSPEVFYKEGGIISVKGSVVPMRKKSSLVGLSFAIDTIAARAVTATAMINK